MERRGRTVQPKCWVNCQRQEERIAEAKPFEIPKRQVWEAYRRVKANGGAAGVDARSIAEFEEHLGDNLYKLWNRLSSGSYFPPPVRLCEIPKDDGRKRTLGIPTVSDRIAQTVGKLALEPKVEPKFDPDSYGYRPGKSAKEAIGVARQRCWKYNWVIDVDIKGFFDYIDHQLMLEIARKHTTEKWQIKGRCPNIYLPYAPKTSPQRTRYRGACHGAQPPRPNHVS